MAEIHNVEEFRQYVLENMSVDPDEVPVGAAVAWFNNPTTGLPTLFEVGRAVPFDPYSGVLALFQTEATFRIYTIAMPIPTPRPADWIERRPARYTLSRIAPTYLVETMSWDILAEQVVRDGNSLAARSELDQILDYIEGKGETINRDELVSELVDGAHTQEPDEEPEEEEKVMPIVDGKQAPALQVAKA